jgi:hypothetical protein
MAARKKNTGNDTGAPGPAAGPPGGDGAEMAEERTEVVTYAAAVDIAKGSGMVCTQTPGSRPDRKRQRVWGVEAVYNQLVALMDHLRCEGIERLVLEHLRLLADLVPPGRGRQAGGVAGQREGRQAPARPGQKATGKTACGCAS